MEDAFAYVCEHVPVIQCIVNVSTMVAVTCMFTLPTVTSHSYGGTGFRTKEPPLTTTVALFAGTIWLTLNQPSKKDVVRLFACGTTNGPTRSSVKFALPAAYAHLTFLHTTMVVLTATAEAREVFDELSIDVKTHV